MSLTPKQQRFVEEYLVDLNATQAAIRAGYSAKTSGATGHENLNKPEIAAAVAAAKGERAEALQISQQWVLERLVEITERCMQHAPVLDRKGDRVMVETPDGEEAAAYTFDAKGANAALALLAKHTGGFVDRRELAGPGGGPIETHEVGHELGGLPKTKRDAIRAAIQAAMEKS